MTEVQLTEAEYAHAMLGELIEQRLNDALRRRARQKSIIEHHIRDMQHDLRVLLDEVDSEDPTARYGNRGHHWQENGQLQGYGGKLDQRLAVLATMDDEIRSLRAIHEQYLVS